MVSQHQARELALQLLFAWDAHGEPAREMAAQLLADGAEDERVRKRAREMAEGAWNGRELSDAWVERLAPKWPPRRQPAVDRNLLRLAVWELTNADTPAKVVIDEAIELAKTYSTENSPSFVNGVLDAVLKEHQALTKE